MYFLQKEGMTHSLNKGMKTDGKFWKIYLPIHVLDYIFIRITKVFPSYTLSINAVYGLEPRKCFRESE